MSECNHDWEIPDALFGDSYFACRLCPARESVWERHENAQAEIAKLKKVVESIDAKFKSRNTVPVDRIFLTFSEWRSFYLKGKNGE